MNRLCIIDHQCKWRPEGSKLASFNGIYHLDTLKPTANSWRARFHHYTFTYTYVFDMNTKHTALGVQTHCGECSTLVFGSEFKFNSRTVAAAAWRSASSDFRTWSSRSVCACLCPFWGALDGVRLPWPGLATRRRGPSAADQTARRCWASRANTKVASANYTRQISSIKQQEKKSHRPQHTT